jgi:hypothetical protein
MADIRQTPPIAPLLPPTKGTAIRKDQDRRNPQRDKDKPSQQPPDRDDDHHVDEYA